MPKQSLSFSVTLKTYTVALSILQSQSNNHKKLGNVALIHDTNKTIPAVNKYSQIMLLPLTFRNFIQLNFALQPRFITVKATMTTIAYVINYAPS